MTDLVEFLTLARPKSATLQVPFLLMRMFEDLHYAMSALGRAMRNATHITVDNLWCPFMQIFQTKGDVKHHSQLKKSQEDRSQGCHLHLQSW